MGEHGSRKRKKWGLGRLYKRGTDGKEYALNSRTHGIFWLEYRVGGKRKRQPLRHPDGSPITRLREAELERQRIMKPFVVAERADQLRDIQDILAHTEDELVTAERSTICPPRWDEAWDAYFRSQIRPRSGAATLTNYERHLRMFIAWLAEHYPEAEDIAAVTPIMASDYSAYLDPDSGDCPCSANTFNKRMGFLRLFYRVMVEDGRVDANPFAKIRRRPAYANSRKELTVEQIQRLVSTASGELQLLLGLGYFTGLRRGDCCTLRWSEVDLVRGIITRVPNKTGRRKDNPEPVKIGIPSDLHGALSRIPPEIRQTYVLPDMAALYLDQSRRHRISRMISRHFENCGITTIRPGTGRYKDPDTGAWVNTGKRAVVDYGFHSLRYSYISHHAEHGTPQAVIQANAGHKSPAMTEHYTKVSDDTARRVAAVLSLAPARENAEAKPDSICPREPLPAWSRRLIESMTEDNWASVRAVLLGGGA